MPAENITLYAKWTINQYSITYEVNGGSPLAPISLAFGANLTTPNIPTKQGHTFVDWYADQALTTLFSFSGTMPAQDLIVYAKWTVNQYTITFESNQGTSVNTITQDFNSPLTQPSNPTRLGYSFLGWYIDNYTFNNPYTFSTTMPAENITLYAKWTVNQYTITYEVDGGSPIAPITLAFGANLSTPNLPTKQGHTFVDWYSDQGLNTVFSFSGTMPAQNLIVYAKWTVNQYTITYEVNGGSAINPDTLNFGSNITSPFDPTKAGHSFVGWYIDQGLTNLFNFSTTMPAENITLYAKWTINEYSISYNTVLPEKFISISSLRDFSLAITHSGKLYAWGLNESGQLGDGTVISKNRPTLIVFAGLQFGETIQSVSAGSSHSLAVTTNGRVYGWGNNSNRQLGDGTTTNRTTPTLISFTNLQNGEAIQSVSAGFSHSIALTTHGNIYTWGKNDRFQIGDGTITNRATPTLVSFNGLQNEEIIMKISAGQDYNLTVTSNGRVFVWGLNILNQLGDGTDTNRSVPTLIAFTGFQSGETIQDVIASTQHSLAITTHGRIYSWGFGGGGLQGDGTQNNQSRPNPIFFDGLENGETIQSVSAGYSHSLAVTTNGRVYGWGNNSNSQLGDGTTTNRTTPTLIAFTNLQNGESIQHVEGGNNHSLSLTTKGRIYVWGNNNSGRLGDGTTTNRAEPLNLIHEIPNHSNQITNYLVITFGEQIQLQDPELEGYVFVGWFMDEALTIPLNLTTMPNYNLSLYASFSPLVY